MAEPGQKTVTVPPEAFAKWQAKTEPVVAAWADGRKKGKEALDKYRALYAQRRLAGPLNHLVDCGAWHGLARLPPCLIGEMRFRP